MALKDDLAADFLLVDGLEPVLFRRLTEEGNITLEISVSQALQRAATEQVQVGDRWLAADEKTVWHFLVSALSGQVPRRGDVIVGPGNIQWVVWVVETQTFAVRYRLTCVRN